MSEINVENLITLAMNASENSYSPYSNFKVGACLLSKNGKTYLGCNVENASFGATICAERCAYLNAISNGEKEFLAIAVVAGNSPTPPCGICRQFMAEFGDVKVIMSSLKGEYEVLTLHELLPNAFNSF